MATSKHTVDWGEGGFFKKTALWISCMLEINVKQYNTTARETSHSSY